MAPTLMVLFAQLILVLPKVHNSTDRGGGVRSYFHQVIAAFLSLSKGVRRLKDAELFSFRANDTNFSDSDLTIHTQFGNDRPPLFLMCWLKFSLCVRDLGLQKIQHFSHCLAP